MGWLAPAFRNVSAIKEFAPLAVSSWIDGRAQLPDGKYETFAREGYAKNELVFAAIEELASSAAEPRWKVRRGKEWTTEHPVLDILVRPNPFLDGFSFWSTIIMHRCIAGNAYALKVRSASGKVRELWLMRPDRVSIVPDSKTYIKHFEYSIGGGDVVKLPPEDVIHWKTRNPLDDFYGMPPLMAASGRVDVDNYMRDFVKQFFIKAGVPAGLISIKGKVSDTLRQEMQATWRNDYGGPAGWHKLMVIDQDASFTQMTQNLGPSGLVVPNLDEISEARILMVFQVPPELIGARVGMQNSSYAQKRAARENFWDETLSPLYKELAGPVNLRLKPDFPGIDEILPDLSDVRALQEDVDKVHARERSDLMAGGITIEEFRLRTGRDAKVKEGTFLIPSNLVPVSAAQIADDSVDLSATRAVAAPAAVPNAAGG